MLKSRRGLLAAGLTVAVVGTIGVVSTLNAGAEQIPDAPAAAVSASAPADTTTADTPAEVTPPALLPWGEKPRSIRKGRNGASSKSLKEAGLSAAPDSASESRGNRYAPKGRAPRTGVHRTGVVPPSPAPAPGSTSSPDVAKPEVFFHYNVGSQEGEFDAAYANLTISKPSLKKEDFHTLAEIAVRSKDQKHTVEVGWTVDRALHGDDDPHLFVFHWVNDKPTCYNTCGFVPWKDIKPGATLPYDTQKRFGIQFEEDAWWVAYDTGWVGYFPAANWRNNFQKGELVQMFGEIAASNIDTCTQMGNGIASFDKGASRFGSVAYRNGPEPDMHVYSQLRGPGVKDKTPSHIFPIFSKTKASARTFRFGGPGCKADVEPTEEPTPSPTVSPTASPTPQS